MAIFRQVHTLMWRDPWFLELSPEEKLLFIYLFSNESTSICGMYEISPRVIAFETGLTLDFIVQAMSKFQDAGKIMFDDGIIWVKRLRYYHETSSSTVQTRIKKDLAKVPEGRVKAAYTQGIDTLLIGYKAGGDPGNGADAGVSIPYTQPVDTVGIPTLNKAKQTKRKPKEKAKKKTPPKDAMGGLFILFGVDPDQVDNKTRAAIEQLITTYGATKVMGLAYQYHSKGMAFRPAIQAIGDQIKHVTESEAVGDGNEPGYY